MLVDELDKVIFQLIYKLLWRLPKLLQDVIHNGLQANRSALPYLSLLFRALLLHETRALTVVQILKLCSCISNETGGIMHHQEGYTRGDFL